MDRTDFITAGTGAVLGILTLVIGLNVIPLDENGYAQRPIDVAFVVVLFATFWSMPVGICAGYAITAPPTATKNRHPSGPSYKTKNVDGLTVRD